MSSEERDLADEHTRFWGENLNALERRGVLRDLDDLTQLGMRVAQGFKFLSSGEMAEIVAEATIKFCKHLEASRLITKRTFFVSLVRHEAINLYRKHFKNKVDGKQLHKWVSLDTAIPDADAEEALAIYGEKVPDLLDLLVTEEQSRILGTILSRWSEVPMRAWKPTLELWIFEWRILDPNPFGETSNRLDFYRYSQMRDFKLKQSTMYRHLNDGFLQLRRWITSEDEFPFAHSLTEA